MLGIERNVPSRCGVLGEERVNIASGQPAACTYGARETKNWLPFVFGPLFAIASTPAPVKCSSGCCDVSSLVSLAGLLSTHSI
jgi:hypothetical protein